MNPPAPHPPPVLSAGPSLGCCHAHPSCPG